MPSDLRRLGRFVPKGMFAAGCLASLLMAPSLGSAQGDGEDDADDAAEEPSILEKADLQGEGRFLFRHNVLRAPDRSVEDVELHDDHSEIINRLDLHHQSGPLGISGTFYTGLVTPRELVFLDPERVDGLSQASLFDLNRLTVDLRGDAGELRAGDFYAVLMRGGLLQISQAPGIDLDVALRGAALRGDVGLFSLRAFGGKVNPQSLTFIQQNIDPGLIFPPYTLPESPSLLREPPGDVIGGAIAEVFSLPGLEMPLSLGVASTLISLDPETVIGAEATPGRRLDLQGYGAYVDTAPIPGLSLYAEADAFAYRLESLDGPSPFVTLPEYRPGGGPLGTLRGYLFYASALYGAGPVSVLLETKRSRDNQHFNVRSGGLRGYGFGLPPSLEYERAVVEDNGLTIISNDIQATHGRVDVNAGSMAQLRFDVYRATDFDLNLGRQAPERILHLYGGVDFFAPSGLHVSFIVGRRRGVLCDELESEIPGETPECAFVGTSAVDRLGFYGAQGLTRPNDILWHGDGEIAMPVGPVEVAYSTGLVHFTVIDQDVAWFYQWQNSLGFRKGEHLGVTLYGDVSNNGQFLEVRVDESGALVNDQWGVGQGWLSTDLDQEGAFPSRLHYAAEVIFNPSWRYELGLFYGSIMGGVRCAGGQCRSLPAFSGGKLTFTYRFG